MEGRPKDADITSILFYIRAGRKHWVVGDSQGLISLLDFNGTVIGTGETYRGQINSFDRFGQSLTFATDHNVGIFDLNTMEVAQVCEGSTSKFTDVVIDATRSSNIVYASMENGDVLVYDTRY
jgi:hypothetical protein